MTNAERTLRPTALPYAALLTFVLAACGDDPPSVGDGTTGEPPPPADQPDAEGQTCDEPGTMGWQFACHVEFMNAWYDSTVVYDTEDPFVLGDLFPDAVSCCGGCAPAAEADQACEDHCYAKLCADLKALHEANMGTGCGDGVFGVDCSFPMTECRAGELTGVQIVRTGWWSTAEFHVLCSGVDALPDPPAEGCFGFGVGGVDEPPTCQLPDELGPVVGGSDYVGREGAGTAATVTWAFGSQQGGQRSDALAAEIAYSLVPCEAAECVQLQAFDVDLPSTVIEGISLQAAHLRLASIDVTPHLGARGNFTIPAGTMRVALSAKSGDTSWYLSGTNAADVSGRVHAASDTLSLTGLSIDYGDSELGASLTVDVRGSFDRRRPEALITVVDEPLDCAEPVAFAAATIDYDGDALQHRWVYGDSPRQYGALLEAVLGAGSHTISLTSVDETGAFDTDVLVYDRKCL